jgi:hypothetical protein
MPAMARIRPALQRHPEQVRRQRRQLHGPGLSNLGACRQRPQQRANRYHRAQWPGYPHGWAVRHAGAQGPLQRQQRLCRCHPRSEHELLHGPGGRHVYGQHVLRQLGRDQPHGSDLRSLPRSGERSHRQRRRRRSGAPTADARRDSHSAGLARPAGGGHRSRRGDRLTDPIQRHGTGCLWV